MPNVLTWRLKPPIGERPIAANGFFSQAWSEHFQRMAALLMDPARLAALLPLDGSAPMTGPLVAPAVGIGVGGPTWTSGTAVPSSVQPVGSIYSRVGGPVGACLYVSRGGGVWAAVAGV